MYDTVPKVLYDNTISGLLNEIKDGYGKLTRKGYIYGLIAVDQDAKIIAVDSRFDRSLNYWDLSAIGAALFGVSHQGQHLFEADFLERASIIYNNLQLFAKSIGQITMQGKGNREILIIILADKDVNIGVIQLQMDRFSAKIKSEIEKNGSIIKTLQMNEHELKEHIKKLKLEIFANRIGSNP